MGKPKEPGLDPAVPRKDKNDEEQRLEAIKIVTSHRIKVYQEASKNSISPVAVAGAILWEGIEDPDSKWHPRSLRYGPGHVHTFWESHKHPFKDSEAKKVEIAGYVKPPAHNWIDRFERLQDPDWAITYIAAIMARHADNYEKIAKVDIRDDDGVLCTLYHGGHSEERAKKLANNQKSNPTVKPVTAGQMGLWVVKWQAWIQQLLSFPPGDYPSPPKSTRVV